MPRSRRLVLSVVALLLVGSALTAPAASPTRVVRVPAKATDDLAQLGLHPEVDLDYGGFRWLELESAELDRMIAAGVPHTVVAGAGTVQVLGYRFDPVHDGEPEVLRQVKADRGPGLRLIQLVGPVRDDWVSELAALGMRLLQYYPHNAYLVWADASTAEAAGRLGFVRWHGPIAPAMKIDADLDGRLGPIRNVDVMLYDDGALDDTLEAIADLGGLVLRHYPSQPDRAFFDAIVELDAAHLADVAELAAVLWLGHESPQPMLDDEMSDQIVAGNHPGGVPVTGYSAHLASLGVDGTGVTWAIVDTGVDYDHPDLGPHISGGYDFPGACSFAGQPGSDCSGGGHGTHVAGIVGGDATAGYTDGDGFLYGLGMAPAYGIFAMNSLSAPAWPPVGGWQEHSKRAVLGNAIGGNNSWTTGEGTQHGYQASERTHDFMVRDGNFDTTSVAEPFIEVFSAGNSGASGLTAPKEAKNLIVTANSLNYRAGSIDAISSSSSVGPAVDGRWVPTVAAPGTTIASARNDLGGHCSTAISGTDNLYAFCSGTSMAAPHVSGALVLATEWWRAFNAGADPSPAMAKALIVNGAVDMGAANRPNISEGWGRVNISNIIQPGVPVVYKDQTTTFDATGESLVVSVAISDPARPLKVTLAWSDAPGAVGANPALVNNLDLRVTTDGQTYKGNVFSGGWSSTGGVPDTVNNLENVFVASPGDTATITVDATAIVGDGVPLAGDLTDQDLALVCFNCVEQADFTLAVAPDSTAACAPDDGTFTVDIGQILGFSDPVALAASGHPAGTTASFSTNPVTPPGTSTLTISDTGGAAAGSYPIRLDATSTTGTKSRTVTFDLFTAAPGGVQPVAPADGAVNQQLRPRFEWTAADQAGTYHLEVATEQTFANLVVDETGIADAGFQPGSDLATNTQHWWRVTADNACGSGATSAAFTFVTEALPGDCSLGSQAVTELFDDFESGAAGWTHAGTGDTWALSTARYYSAAQSFHADDPSATSDQRLVSPPVDLPTGASPLTLQVWNWQQMEARTGGCWDGGDVEISTDDGASWTPLPDEVMLTDSYDGPTTGLGGLDGWCDDLDPSSTLWKKAVVDLDDYAGETVRLSFRLGSDSWFGREGWYIDDVKVQSCQAVGCEAPSGLDNNTATDVDGCADSGVLVSWDQEPDSWGDGGVGIRTYDVLRDGSAIHSGITYGTTSWTDTTGADGTTYTYAVRYENGCGRSSTTSGQTAADTVAPDTPAAPAVADADPCVQSGVQISWGAVAGATTYDLRVDGSTVVSDVTSPHAYDPGDTASHTYEVRARNASCTGEWSQATPAADGDSSLGAVTAPVVSDPDPCAQTGVVISWQDVANATSYDLRVDATTLVTGVTSPWLYDPGDHAAHTYEIRAGNPTCGLTPWSSPVTTADGTPAGEVVLCDGFESGDTAAWARATR